MSNMYIKKTNPQMHLKNSDTPSLKKKFSKQNIFFLYMQTSIFYNLFDKNE